MKSADLTPRFSLHLPRESVMGVLTTLAKWVSRRPTSPPPPNGPAKPSV